MAPSCFRTYRGSVKKKAQATVPAWTWGPLYTALVPLLLLPKAWRSPALALHIEHVERVVCLPLAVQSSPLQPVFDWQDMTGGVYRVSTAGRLIWYSPTPGVPEGMTLAVVLPRPRHGVGAFTELFFSPGRSENPGVLTPREC